jgi:hypothetical protein
MDCDRQEQLQYLLFKPVYLLQMLVTIVTYTRPTEAKIDSAT